MSAKTKRATDKSVSMRDIAEEVGVSVAAVSYAVNERQGLISDETRDRILQTAKRMDYQPNRLMQAVRTSRTDVIGVLIPSFQTTFFPEIIDGIERALAESGYHAVMCQTHSSNELTEENLAVLRQRRVDGLIVVPKFDQSLTYKKIEEARIKTVFVDAYLEDIWIPSVQSDDLTGSQQAVRHLIDHGHRRIATMRQPDGLLHGGMRARFEGYCRALTEAGIPFDEELVSLVEPGPNTEEGYEAAKHIIRREDVTAVFAPSDMGALGVMKAAREAGMSLPDDLAIAGYCNQNAGLFTTPTLTTVDQKPGKIGRAAVERLLAMIEGKEDKYPLHHFIQPELIIRESCGTH
jgi:LacI family transcriptional regulator